MKKAKATFEQIAPGLYYYDYGRSTVDFSIPDRKPRLAKPKKSIRRKSKR